MRLNKHSDMWQGLPDHSVTFGDILTLILSFFVLMVSLDQFKLLKGAAGLPLEVGESSGLLKAELNQDGTLLAFSSKDHSLPIKGWWFDALTADALLTADVMGSREGEWAIRDRLVAVACARATTTDPWKVSEERALKMFSLLQSIGVRKESIGLQVLGPHCDGLGSKIPSEAVMAVKLG